MNPAPPLNMLSPTIVPSCSHYLFNIALTLFTISWNPCVLQYARIKITLQQLPIIIPFIISVYQLYTLRKTNPFDKTITVMHTRNTFKRIDKKYLDAP